MQRRGVDELCRNTLKCIVTEAAGLCRDTGSRHSRARPQHSRRGAQVERWALGRGARDTGAGRATRVLGAGHGRWARGAGARHTAQVLGARHRRWARGTDAGRAGWPRLCTWCTQPVFDPVPSFSRCFGPLFMNTVHEHCSPEFFLKKIK